MKEILERMLASMRPELRARMFAKKSPLILPGVAVVVATHHLVPDLVALDPEGDAVDNSGSFIRLDIEEAVERLLEFGCTKEEIEQIWKDSEQRILNPR